MQRMLLLSDQEAGALFVFALGFILFLVLYHYTYEINSKIKILSGKEDDKIDFAESSVSWNCVSSWIKNVKDRKVIIKEFNNAAQASYINGQIPYQLKCSLSRGNDTYKHSTSAWLCSGFRIIVMTDQLVSEIELNRIGLSVLADSKVVRFLITLGWDTLEVINYKGKIGVQWELSKWAAVSLSAQENT
jgi:hypothetical protein